MSESYICESGGVLAGGRTYFPAWRPAVGEIVDISLNALEDVRGADDLAQTRAIMAAWSGCAYLAHWGRYGSMVFTGGGHDDGKLNAIYRYDIETRLFTQIKPSAAWHADANSRIADALTGWMWADASGTTLQVGEPFAAHFYAGLVGVPAAAVPGVANGLLLTAGRSTMPRLANAGTSQAHAIRLGQDAQWAAHGAPLTVDTGYGGACWDAPRNRVVSFAGALRTSFCTHDVASGASATVPYTKAAGYPQLDNYYRAAFHDAASDRYLTIDVRAPYALALIHPLTGLIVEATTAGTAPTGSGGWEWVEAWGALVFYPGSGNTVWTLKRPADPLADPWVWASQTLVGTARAQAGANPHYTRFRYAPRLDAFLWASACNAPVQIFRITPP